VNVSGKYINNNNSTNDTTIASPSLLSPPTADGDDDDDDDDDESTTSLPSQSSIMMSSGGSVICYRLRSNWKVLVLGQILSLLLACAGAAQATLHLNCGLSAPTFTMSLVYLGLTLIHLPILLWKRFFGEQKQQRRGGGQERISTHDSNDNDGILIADDEDNNKEEADENDDDGINIDNNVNNLPFLNRSFLWYLLLAFFDVEANALTMLAFRYTTLTSVTLFDALAIPASMIISKCIFQYRRYRTLHYFGLAICMMGIVLNVLQDYEYDTTSNSSGSDSSNFTDDNEETVSITTEQQYYPHKVKGDICAIIGGLLYGLNDGKLKSFPFKMKLRVFVCLFVC
jgi:solute carrier family 35 protein F1/2